MFIEATGKKVDGKIFVFCDLDETLVHSMEYDWLKDSPGNREYAKLAVPGKSPYPGVFKIKDDGREYHIFPRPGSTHFIKECSKFADVYILSHAGKDYEKKVVKAMGWDKYIKGGFRTGEQAPESLGARFNLLHHGEHDQNSGNKWVLIDNLPMRSVEICSKLRILGLGDPKNTPVDDVRRIQAVADKHFIKVEEWVPTVGEYDDYDLWRALPKVKYLLDIADLK